jgi:hypothetical protein
MRPPDGVEVTLILPFPLLLPVPPPFARASLTDSDSDDSTGDGRGSSANPAADGMTLFPPPQPASKLIQLAMTQNETQMTTLPKPLCIFCPSFSAEQMSERL